LLHAF
jgi:hypothetical protein